MNCPVCPSVSLVMADRSGVEIDYCPKCRGVWLDRGELDKIIERASADDDAPRGRPSAPSHPPTAGYGPAGHGPGVAPGAPHPGYGAPPPGYNPNADSKAGYPYRKKSMWREMFDF